MSGMQNLTDSLLFIDANKYLDLYRTKTGKLNVAALSEQAAHIFVTQQVVDEVKRNKIKVAAHFLKKEFEKLTLSTYNVPDHLFGETEEQSRIILEMMQKIRKDVAQLNKKVAALAAGIMNKVSQSTDEVSTALAPIFAKAVCHSDAQLQKAKDRKERGDPTGKTKQSDWRSGDLGTDTLPVCRQNEAVDYNGRQ